MRSRLIAAAGLAVLVTGCGSTVQVASRLSVGLGQGGNDGLTSTGAGTGAGIGTRPGDSGGLGGSGTGTSGGLANGAAGAAAGSAPAGGSAPGTTGSGSANIGVTGQQGPGVTATTISLGLPYIKNAEAAGAAIGVSAGGGDQRSQWKVIIDEINRHRGGILGRQIVPIYHPIDATSTDSYDAQEGVACSDYHQDNHVFAVLDSSVNGVLQACTEKAKAVMVSEKASLSYSSVATFSRFPHYVEVGELRLDRMAKNWPPALADQNYFTPWNTTTGAPGAAPVKVGILYLDDAASTYSVNNVLVPALAALGQSNPDVISVQSPKSTSDNGSTVAAIQAAVLKFRGDGVTHFLPFDPTGGVGLFFAQNADKQQYYPRYGLTTSNGAQLLRDTGGIFPEKQLHGALGYGWVPLIDLSASRDPDNGPTSNAPRATCLKLMKDAGQSLTTPVQVRSAVEICDMMTFLKSAIEAGGPAITQASFLDGVNRLGGAFVAGNTFSTTFSSAQHDGVSTGRLFAYSQTCSCFTYTSGLRALA